MSTYQQNRDKKRKQYWALQNVLNSDEKKIINYYELEWHLRSKVPTTQQVARFTGLKESFVNLSLTKRNVTKALKQRGIPWEQHSQLELTEKQIAAATLVMNFVDKRSVEEKLDSLGILPATYYAWLKDPTFKSYVDTLADSNLRNIRPTALTEFTKKINSGEWGAIKFWLETTGELQNNEMPTSETMIRMLIEVIQRHVKDDTIIAAIANDMIAITQNRTLNAPQELPSHAINIEFAEEDTGEDVDLEKAKRMLGYG